RSLALAAFRQAQGRLRHSPLTRVLNPPLAGARSHGYPGIASAVAQGSSVLRSWSDLSRGSRHAVRAAEMVREGSAKAHRRLEKHFGAAEKRRRWDENTPLKR
ncbi:MAG TPA: hypothetical protein VHE61_06355, partial [Opitutaceae bacterium]|nr:hypothetical protein [Opitutaceae bacterium]